MLLFVLDPNDLEGDNSLHLVLSLPTLCFHILIRLSLDNNYGTTCKAKLLGERQFPIKTFLSVTYDNKNCKRCYFIERGFLNVVTTPIF